LVNVADNTCCISRGMGVSKVFETANVTHKGHLKIKIVGTADILQSNI